MIPSPIAIMGVTGTVGSRVAERLASRVRVRGVCRDPSRFLGPPGIELVRADLTSPEEAEEAIHGARGIYLTPPEEGNDPLTDELTVAQNVVTAARRNHVRHLIVHTALQAKQGHTGARLIDNKTEVERIVKASGVPYTILRPGWFLENLRVERPAMEQGRLALPLAHDHAFATVSANDVANAAVRFFEAGPQNRGYDLHLEGGMRPDDLTEAASRVQGRPVKFQEADVESFLHAIDASEAQKELHRELFNHIRRTEFLGDPAPVKAALPGFRYTTPDEVLRRELFRTPLPLAAPETPQPPRPQRRRPGEFEHVPGSKP